MCIVYRIYLSACLSIYLPIFLSILSYLIFNNQKNNLGSTGQVKVPKGIPSGGINITVVGTNFNYIQDPAIYVLHNNSRHTGKCKVKENVTCCGPAPGSNPQYVGNSIYNGWGKRISTVFLHAPASKNWMWDHSVWRTFVENWESVCDERVDKIAQL